MISSQMVLYNKFLTILEAAQKQRSKRRKQLRDGTPEWLAYESGLMLDAVNSERSADGKHPITMQQLLRAEGSAVGHFDYASKYALYCVTLAENE